MSSGQGNALGRKISDIRRWAKHLAAGSDVFWAAVLLLPSIVFLALFTYWPLARTFFLAMHDAPFGKGESYFVGIENIERVVDDPLFWKVLANTAIYTFVTLPLSVGFALGISLLLNGKFRAVGLYRASFFYPVMIPSVAAGLVWVFIYAPGYGLMNHALRAVGLPTLEWLYDSQWALPAIILVNVWKLSGYFMVIFLAGLQLIPNDLYEAAELEGAGLFQKLWYLTLPLLSPTLYFVLIIGLLHTFQVFDFVYVMTAGGPTDSTNVLVYFIYQHAFRYWDMGFASTLAVIFIVLSTIVLGALAATMGRRVFYQGKS